MNKTATVHARIDPETKRSTEAVLEAIGMTPTDAVRLLYRQISLRQEFPLELKVPNVVTTQTLEKTDQGVELETFDSLDDFKKSWE
jgi:DNA-damage-inducible protein J